MCHALAFAPRPAAASSSGQLTRFGCSFWKHAVFCGHILTIGGRLPLDKTILTSIETGGKVLDFLLVHASAIRNGPLYMYMPAGVFGIANELQKAGFEVLAVNEALELALSDDFDLRDFLREHPARFYGLDIHWHEHLHGAISVAEVIKDLYPDARVVVGGNTASYFAADLLAQYPSIDYVIKGYAERRLVALLSESLGGAPPPRGSVLQATEPLDLDALDDVSCPWLLHAEEYGQTSIHQWHPDRKETCRWYRNGVGCLYNCSYCGGAASNQKVLFGHTGLIRRSPARVASDIGRLAEQGIVSVNLLQDLNMGDDDYWRAVFRNLRAERTKISAYMESNQLPSAEFVREFASVFEPSLSTIVLSPLCGDEDVRARNGKRYGNDELRECLGQINASGVRMVLYFSTGFPGEKTGSIVRTRLLKAQLEKEFRPLRSELTYLTLDPGSPMQRTPENLGVVANFEQVGDWVERCRQRSAGERFDGFGYSLATGRRGDTDE